MKEGIQKVHIVTSKLDMASVICLNSKENLIAFLKRMEIEALETWEKEVLATVLKDNILENPEHLIYIYNQDVIEFLVELWENDYIELSHYEWAVIGQLKLTGLVDVPFSDGKENYGQELIVIEEAKDALYFYLKSRSAKTIMQRYNTWESLIRGLVIHYGIISFQRLYYLFCRMIKSPIDDMELHRFLSVRIDLLQFGSFAIERSSGVEYYQNYEITNPESVLDARQESGKLDYYLPDYDEAVYVSDNNGIGKWDGISSLAELFLQKLEFEYYKTVIAIKTCILMIQNNNSRQEVEQYLLASFPESKLYEDKISSSVSLLYQSVPVYALKGWCRKKLKNKQRTKHPFTLIRGGKEES